MNCGNAGKMLPVKYLAKIQETYYDSLDEDWQLLLGKILALERPSFQTFRFLTQMFKDFSSWQELTPASLQANYGVGVLSSGQWLERLKEHYRQLRESEEKNYQSLPMKSHRRTPSVVLNAHSPDHWHIIGREEKILGRCPVASEKTRCCNLLTLDAFRSCGFSCSYCSIQSFFRQQFFYDPALPQKLAQLTAEFSAHPEQLYHLGTGQASDSLLWGNREGALAHLLEFARINPNVILEFKTKSDNINFLLSQTIPPNVICTWSLNPQEVINWEEAGSASLERRLAAASAIAGQGNLVGFHFHPMVYYRDYVPAYQAIASEIIQRFSAAQVAMISFGTLTFTKKVMREIRKKPIPSKILQMPVAEIAGKYSYPLEVKVPLFQNLYRAFTPWHSAVFFYLCMEDIALWDLALGHSYESNAAFELAMTTNYYRKIRTFFP